MSEEKQAFPRKLTHEMRKRLMALLRAGNYVEVAAAACQIHMATINAWLKRGSQGVEPFKTFAKEFHQAVADSETNALDLIVAHGENKWEAAAWRLERRFPDRWGRKRLEITGANGGPMTSQVQLAGGLTQFLAAAFNHAAPTDVPTNEPEPEAAVNPDDDCTLD